MTFRKAMPILFVSICSRGKHGQFGAREKSVKKTNTNGPRQRKVGRAIELFREKLEGYRCWANRTKVLLTLNGKSWQHLVHQAEPTLSQAWIVHLIGYPAKNCLPIFAHDSQVSCGQRLGRVWLMLLTVQQSMNNTDIRQRRCVRERQE